MDNDYWFNLVFHEQLAANVKKHYDINAKWTKTIAWGYNTTAIYMEDIHTNKYIVKLRKYDADKKLRLEKDIFLSHFLHDTLPTPIYLKNLTGSYLSVFNEYFLRLQYFIQGCMPFEMTNTVFKQVLKTLRALHYHSLPTLDIRRVESTVDNNVLLHGDLTPSNILVSNNILTGIIDLESAVIGPIELDLAKTLLFCWFRMPRRNLVKVFTFMLENYGHNIEWKDFKHYLKFFAENYLNDILGHKKDYADLYEWQKQLDFAQKKSKEVDQFSAQQP